MALNLFLALQAGSKEAVISPVALSQHIANSQWSTDLLQAILERVYQVLRATPSAAPQLLQIAGAIASAAASSIQVGPYRLELGPSPAACLGSSVSACQRQKFCMFTCTMFQHAVLIHLHMCELYAHLLWGC